MATRTHTQATLVSDGSSPQDSHPIIEIDREDPADRYRYACPNNHTYWQQTNGGIWCQECSRAVGLDPHYHHVYDKKTGETIPWSSVELVE